MESDVVVVGGGGAGLAAAIEAASLGANVVLLEKNAALGGTTARSIGSITATCTPHQMRAGIADSPEEHYEDMPLFARDLARPDNETLRRVLTENVPETVRWLCELGVEFFGPLEEPPHRKPRMHNVLPNSRAYIFHLERRARRLGVRIFTGARARRLLVAGGRVAGVEFDQNGQHGLRVLARRGVVLATGDYSADPEMKGRYISRAVADTEPVNPASTGDGHRMALELGARILNGDLFLGGIRFAAPPAPPWIGRLPPWRWLMRLTGFALRYAPQAVVRRFVMAFLTTVLVPSHKLFEAGAILVNREGERFSDETKSWIPELAYQPGGIAYIVFDGEIAHRFSRWPHYISTAPGFAYAYLEDYRNNRPELFHEAPTLGALATALGMAPQRLEASVAHYNEGTTGRGESPAPAAPPRGSRPALRTAPYYALGPVRNYINFTDGGLAVSERLEVLDSEGRPIRGLFAAGSVGQGGLLLKGHGHHLGWAFTSGRIAGRQAAAADSEPAASVRVAARGFDASDSKRR